MISPEVLSEAVAIADVVRKREISSKIKGANGYLQTLLQKRIRIDLEIKKTTKRIARLKKLVNPKISNGKKASSARSLQSLQEIVQQYNSIISEEGLNPEDINSTLEALIHESDGLLDEVAQMQLSES